VPEGAVPMVVPSLGPEADWSGALEGVEAVVHAAARVPGRDEAASDPLAEYLRVNVEGPLALARQAAAAGVRRFVFLSSIKVNGEATAEGRPFRVADEPAPEDAYGMSKREAEHELLSLARESAMEVVIIRPPLVYGPGSKGNFAPVDACFGQGLAAAVGGGAP
jgi:nucleoside-diphosphate-sugar epimerase